MAIISFPYVSMDEDRKITASEEAQGFDLIMKTGVIKDEGDELEVEKANGAMAVHVNTGGAVIAGRRCIVDDTETVNIDAGDGNPRIDMIVLESNLNTPVRATRAIAIKGTPASSPEPPTIEDTISLKYLVLASLRVPAGAATLAEASLTDLREYAQGRHGHAMSDVAGKLTGDQIENNAILAKHVSPNHVVGARFIRTTDYNMPDNIATKIGWASDGRVYNPDGSHDADTSKMVARHTGVYTVSAAAEVMSGATRMTIRKNGSPIATTAKIELMDTHAGLSLTVDCVPMGVGDYLDVTILQNSGGLATLVAGAYLSMRLNQF